MADRQSSFEYEELLACGRGDMFGQGNAQLPLPPMLMFSRISSITETGGAHDKGQIVAEMMIAGNPETDWFFDCHFKGNPVMPGCLGLDGLWQLTGFFSGLAWRIRAWLCNWRGGSEIHRHGAAHDKESRICH